MAEKPEKRRRELDVGEPRKHRSESGSLLMMMMNGDHNPSSILQSPLHPSSGNHSQFNFLSDFEGSSRSLLRSPQLLAINGLGSGMSIGVITNLIQSFSFVGKL